MGAAGRACVRDSFALADHVSAMLDVYAHAVAGARPRGARSARP
jgi:hypothetical protein